MYRNCLLHFLKYYSKFSTNIEIELAVNSYVSSKLAKLKDKTLQVNLGNNRYIKMATLFRVNRYL